VEPAYSPYRPEAPLNNLNWPAVAPARRVPIRACTQHWKQALREKTAEVQVWRQGFSLRQSPPRKPRRTWRRKELLRRISYRAGPWSPPRASPFLSYQPLYPRSSPSRVILIGFLPRFGGLWRRKRRCNLEGLWRDTAAGSMSELTENPEQPAGKQRRHRKRENPARCNVAQSLKAQSAPIGGHRSRNS